MLGTGSTEGNETDKTVLSYHFESSGIDRYLKKTVTHEANTT